MSTKKAMGSRQLHRIVLALATLSGLALFWAFVNGFAVHADSSSGQKPHVLWTTIACLFAAVTQAWVLVFSGLTWRFARTFARVAALAARNAAVCSAIVLVFLIGAFLSGARLLSLSPAVHLSTTSVALIVVLAALVLEFRWLGRLHQELGL